MKQKIVVKICMPCDKCRTKAMEIAATTAGVISVALDGKDQDQLVIIGDGVDSVCLTKKLRKNVGYADIVALEEKKEKKKEEKKDEKKEKEPPPITCYCPPYRPLVTYEYEPSPIGCRIV